MRSTKYRQKSTFLHYYIISDNDSLSSLQEGVNIIFSTKCG